MNPDTTTAKPSDAFLTHEVDGKEYHFKRPTTAQLDHALSRARKTMVSAALDFSRATIAESQREAWEVVLSDKPGAAAAVLNAATQRLGFPTE